MKAIILAGGKGTRLRPYTTVLPKPLMPIGDMSIIEIVLRQLSFFGFNDITLAVGYLSELIMAFCNDGKRFGTNISYSHEPKPLGTAGPLSLIKKPSDSFLVMNGDVLTSLNYNDLMLYHKASGNIATVVTFERDAKIQFGIIESNDDNLVTGYTEKPLYHYTVSTGIYVFEPKVLDYITHGVYMDLPDLILSIINDKQRVGCFKFNGHWLDIGRQDDYAEAIQVFDKYRKNFIHSNNNQ